MVQDFPHLPLLQETTERCRMERSSAGRKIGRWGLGVLGFMGFGFR